MGGLRASCRKDHDEVTSENLNAELMEDLGRNHEWRMPGPKGHDEVSEKVETRPLSQNYRLD